VILAINAMFDKPDPKGAEFKGALEKIKGAIK
jgi:hypothetical protein